jgi:predicted class III extradiol MEMO1 family dioxygenase
MVTKAVGVDVGVNGGIVALNTDNSYTSFSMPKTNKEIAELFVYLNPHVAYVEKVSGYIGKAHPASRMFNFGVNFGVILGALHGLDSEVHLIRPQEWQKPLGLPKRDCRTEHKRELKRVAEKMFPNLKLTLKTCDAALILDYGINKNEQ